MIVNIDINNINNFKQIIEIFNNSHKFINIMFDRNNGMIISLSKSELEKDLFNYKITLKNCLISNFYMDPNINQYYVRTEILPIYNFLVFHKDFTKKISLSCNSTNLIITSYTESCYCAIKNSGYSISNNTIDINMVDNYNKFNSKKRNNEYNYLENDYKKIKFL